MGTSSRVKVPRRVSEFQGVDLVSSELLRPETYLADMKNCVYTPKNIIKKRNGYKAIAVGSGGYGCSTYNVFDDDTGEITSEILSVGTTLYKLTTVTMTVTYSGSSSNICYASLYFDTATDQYKFKILENTTSKIDQALGLGFDEASTYTIASLDTAIDAISGGNFTATVSGTNTTPAALLELMELQPFTTATPLTIRAYYWTAVNSPIANMFQWYDDHKDDEIFSNSVPIQYRRSIFWPTPGDYGLLKYDGQTLYRAGVPSINSPVSTAVSAAAGTAEVTSIVCRAEAGNAEVSTVTTIADSGVAEVFTVTCNKNTTSAYRGRYFLTADSAGSVAVWFNSSADAEPSHGADRSIEVNIHAISGSSNIAEQLKIAIDADSQFSAARSSSTVTVTNASGGIRTDVSQGSFSTSDLTVATITQGTSGLNNKYFNIYDSGGKVSVWNNVSSTGVQPSTGASRYIQVTFSSGASANTIATAVKTAVDADSSFAATVVGNVVTVTHSSVGAYTDIEDGDTGFAFAVTTQGVDRLLNKYFTMYDSTNDSVAFWYNIGGVGVEPSHGASRAVEITSVTAGMTAAQVATETELKIEADEWSSSAASATITATSDATGSRTDASAGTSGFTITVTTQGVNAGIGAGTYQQRFTVIQTDHRGVTIEGNPSDATSITLAGGQDISSVIQTVQPTTGFNTGCAKVNGAATAATVITVDSGHTLKVGDQAYLLNSATGEYVTRTVTAISSTSVTLNTAVSIVDNGIISNGLKIGYYRTKVSGSEFYLVAELPNNSIDGSMTYIDTKLDTQLGAQYFQPPVDLSPPGAFKFLTLYKGVAVADGFLSDGDRVDFSDVTSVEYFPADTNSFLADTKNADVTSGTFSNNEVLVVGKIGRKGKGGSFHVVSGSVDENGNFFRDVKTQSIGLASHSGIVEIDEGISAFPTERGIFAMSGGSMPKSISKNISTAFTDLEAYQNQLVSLSRITAINDSVNERILVFLPAEPESGTKYATNNSVVWVFDYQEDDNGVPYRRWHRWTNINAAGGFMTLDGELYWIERRLSTYTGLVSTNLYKMHNTATQSDYQDHSVEISSSVRFGWEHLGDSSTEKFFKEIRVVNTTVPGNAFTLSIKAYFDWDSSSFVVSQSVDIGVDLDDQLIVPFKDEKARSAQVLYENSEAKTDWQIEGYEMHIMTTYNQGMVD